MNHKRMRQGYHSSFKVVVCWLCRVLARQPSCCCKVGFGGACIVQGDVSLVCLGPFLCVIGLSLEGSDQSNSNKKHDCVELGVSFEGTKPCQAVDH